MFQIKVMTPDDYGFAVDLANTMGWGMEKEDFRFNQMLEPEGCLMLFNGVEPAGVATCISFGAVGWFGNLIVKPEHRKHGAGRLLLEHAVKYLKRRDVETVGLYAYQHLKEFYGKSGFKADIDFAVMHNENVAGFDGEMTSFDEQTDFSVLNGFDTGFFGADRSKLLKGILGKENRLCYVSVKDREVNGYVLAKVYEHMAEVGPLVCKPNNEALAKALLTKVLCELEGRQVSIYLPQKQSGLLIFLEEAGFKNAFLLSRMFLGSPKVQNYIHTAESLERG